MTLFQVDSPSMKGFVKRQTSRWTVKKVKTIIHQWFAFICSTLIHLRSRKCFVYVGLVTAISIDESRLFPRSSLFCATSFWVIKLFVVFFFVMICNVSHSSSVVYFSPALIFQAHPRPPFLRNGSGWENQTVFLSWLCCLCTSRRVTM